MLALPVRLRAFLSSKRPNSNAPYEQLPLDALDPADADYQRSPPRPRRTTFSPKPYLLSLLALVLFWFGLSYLYADPEAWDTGPWSSLTSSRGELAPTIVRAAGDKWRGRVSEEGDHVAFLGMRYAEPPVGERRFRRPVAVSVVERLEHEWEELEVKNATEVDEGCPRPARDGDRVVGYEGAEDCLSLNVYTPRRRVAGTLLPVMVWIHGGGFVVGSPHEEQYSPADLLARSQRMNQPILFVSLNYRLNALGFSASPPAPGPPPMAPHVPIQAPEDLDLNVGFKDQLEALQWIHREIANFGGDPTKVTLVGHSAGAISVGLHQLYSPPHLFRAVFMLSGAPTSFPVPWPHDAASRVLHPLPGPAACPAPVHSPSSPLNTPPNNAALLACLRELPIEELMGALGGFFERSAVDAFFPWYPVLEGQWEGSWLDRRPSERIVKGTFSKVPIVMGSVVDEGTRFVDPAMDSQEWLNDALRGIFDFTFGAVETILTPIWAFYPDDPSLGSPYHTNDTLFSLSPTYKRAASLIGDVLFQAPRRHFLRETPKDFGEPSWNYLFDEKRIGAEERMGVQHGADLKSWFGHPGSEDDELLHLSRHMTAYLINFVARMDPNGPGLRTWPQYGMERRTLHLGLHNISIIRDDDRLEAMRFLNVNNPIFAR